MKRLEVIKNHQNSLMIHIDLGDCSNYDIMKELFSCIVIFKGITILNNIYFFDKYVIAIEIPNSFHNMKEKLPIFKSLKDLEITNINKKNFNITNEFNNIFLFNIITFKFFS